MQLNDFTSLFQVEKKFRGVSNLRTPEVSYRAAGWGLATLVVTGTFYWFVLRPLLSVLPVPIILQVVVGVVLVLGSTVAIAKMATTRMRHDKELLDLVTSWVRYRTGARRYADFEAWKPTTVTSYGYLSVSRGVHTPPSTGA